MVEHEKVSFDLLDLTLGFWKDLSLRLLLLLCEMIFMSRFLVFSPNKIVLYYSAFCLQLSLHLVHIFRMD